MKPYVAVRGSGTRRAVVGGLGATTSERAIADVVASSTSTVGAHQRKESSNNIVNVWKLESSRVDDDDEETVELGESNLSLLKYRLTARHLHIKLRDVN
jgi:hypothetical protein